MAGIPPGKFPSPTPKYPYVGKNYQANGELNGLDYNYLTDKYRPNEEAAQNAGLLPKPVEQPGLIEQVMPIAVGLGTAEAAKGAGGLIGGMFGSGSAATATPGAALTGEAATGAGLLGSGTAAATPTSLVGSTALAPGGSPGLLGTAASTGMGSIGALPLAGIGLGLLAGAKGVKDLLAGKEGTSSLEGLAGRGTLGIATGGLSELARATGLLGRKSIRERTKDVTNELLSKDKENSNWQNYVQGMREQYNSEAPDPSKPFGGGKYGSWDEYVKGGLEASDLTGVAGNLQVYGPQWADLTQEQRQAVTQKNIEAGLYNSKDGDVFITDKLKALDILNSIINPTSTTPTGTPMSPVGVIDPTKATPIDITRN